VWFWLIKNFWRTESWEISLEASNTSRILVNATSIIIARLRRIDLVSGWNTEDKECKEWLKNHNSPHVTEFVFVIRLNSRDPEVSAANHKASKKSVKRALAVKTCLESN
jgi:hypothetical protein